MDEQLSRRERKRLQMREHLADTAWQMFESQDYDMVTMEAIAEAADVAKGTLYKHFPVKESLLRHRFHSELAKAAPELLTELAVLPTVEVKLRTFLDRSAQWSIQNRQHLAPYLRLRLSEAGVPYDPDSPNRSGIEQLFSGLIREGQECGEFHSNLHSSTAAHYLEFLYLASLLRWLNGSDVDLHAEFQTMLDLYLGGLKG